jgi:hypothetical protein
LLEELLPENEWTAHDFMSWSTGTEFHDVNSVDTCDLSGLSHAERDGGPGIHIVGRQGTDRRWKELCAVPGLSE